MTSDRPAHETDEEIEITDEMIEAGEAAFYSFDPRFGDGADYAIAIFEAMTRASPAYRCRKK